MFIECVLTFWQLSDVIMHITDLTLQGAAEKSGPLNFFTVFSATVWDFNTKFYSFIYWNFYI